LRVNFRYWHSKDTLEGTKRHKVSHSRLAISLVSNRNLDLSIDDKVSDVDKLWYRDYTDGFAFLTPVYIDLFHFILFGVAGYYGNQLVIWSLGGDSFWGWSIAACLAIPSTFINLFRDKLPTCMESEMIVSDVVVW